MSAGRSGDAPSAAPRRRPPAKAALRRLLVAGKRAFWRRRNVRYARDAARAASGPRVLVAMNEGIGNAVEATPLVQAIRSLWPRAHITLLVVGADLFREWSLVDRVVESDAEIRDRRFDETFVAWRARLPEDLSAARLGRVHHVRCRFRSHMLKPERESNLDLVRRLGFAGPAPPLHVCQRRPDLELPHAPMRFALVPGSKPDFRWRHKRWPFYAELAEGLLKAYPEAQVCVVGGPDDALEASLPDDDRAFDLRGRLSLSEAAWLLRHTTVAIGNDCGPMHVADAVRTAAIVIFGPTEELKNGPLYRAIPVSADVPCRPCQDTPAIMSCRDPICMTRLAPARILEEVQRLLTVFPGESLRD